MIIYQSRGPWKVYDVKTDIYGPGRGLTITTWRKTQRYMTGEVGSNIMMMLIHVNTCASKWKESTIEHFQNTFQFVLKLGGKKEKEYKTSITTQPCNALIFNTFLTETVKIMILIFLKNTKDSISVVLVEEKICGNEKNHQPWRVKWKIGLHSN